MTVTANEFNHFTSLEISPSLTNSVECLQPYICTTHKNPSLISRHHHFISIHFLFLSRISHLCATSLCITAVSCVCSLSQGLMFIVLNCIHLIYISHLSLTYLSHLY